MAKKCIHGANKGQCGYCGDETKKGEYDKPDERGSVSWGPCGKCGKTIQAANAKRLGRMVASHMEKHERT